MVAADSTLAINPGALTHRYASQGFILKGWGEAWDIPPFLNSEVYGGMEVSLLLEGT